jgi:hypothetical protein
LDPGGRGDGSADEEELAPVDRRNGLTIRRRKRERTKRERAPKIVIEHRFLTALSGVAKPELKTAQPGQLETLEQE